MLDIVSIEHVWTECYLVSVPLNNTENSISGRNMVLSSDFGSGVQFSFLHNTFMNKSHMVMFIVAMYSLSHLQVRCLIICSSLPRTPLSISGGKMSIVVWSSASY